MTFIEVIIAGAILSIVTLAVISSIVQLFKMEQSSSEGMLNQQIVAMITESVKSDSSVHQKNLSGVDIVSTNPLNLPLGYATGMNLIPRTQCTNGGPNVSPTADRVCSVFVGYVIQPIAGMPGLFQGRVRTHTPANGDTPARDAIYNFMTTAK